MDINAAMTTATKQMINSLGKSATYTPQGGSPKLITVLFDDEYEAIDLSAGMVSSSGPAAYCKSEDIPDIQKADALTVDGTDYTVREIKPDGTGMIVLILKKA